LRNLVPTLPHLCARMGRSPGQAPFPSFELQITSVFRGLALLSLLSFLPLYLPPPLSPLGCDDQDLSIFRVRSAGVQYTWRASSHASWACSRPYRLGVAIRGGRGKEVQGMAYRLVPNLGECGRGLSEVYQGRDRLRTKGAVEPSCPPPARPPGRLSPCPPRGLLRSAAEGIPHGHLRGFPRGVKAWA
jgi:hypothetical protein